MFFPLLMVFLLLLICTGLIFARNVYRTWEIWNGFLIYREILFKFFEEF